MSRRAEQPKLPTERLRITPSLAQQDAALECQRYMERAREWPMAGPPSTIWERAAELAGFIIERFPDESHHEVLIRPRHIEQLVGYIAGALHVALPSVAANSHAIASEIIRALLRHKRRCGQCRTELATSTIGTKCNRIGVCDRDECDAAARRRWVFGANVYPPVKPAEITRAPLKDADAIRAARIFLGEAE